MELFIRANAGDAAFEHWARSVDPEVRERVLNNGAVFFPIELPAFARFAPDRAVMRASGVPMTVVLGEESRGTFLEAAAAWLIEGTGAELVMLPGGHGGFVTHPHAFVEVVRRVAR
jgi:pimeloyl-ACP methyl ester carboxylesterase